MNNFTSNFEMQQHLETSTSGNNPRSFKSLDLDKKYWEKCKGHYLSKHIISGKVCVRHTAGLANQIDKHLLKAGVLRKINKGALKKVVKRWFVLYDDSHNPISAGETGIKI